MPSDPRLWMTFPIDFWMHPKMRPLSDAALRCFVEINGYSRMNDLDGRVPVAAAEATWKKKSLLELTQNHPERPSLTIEDGAYVIWNYAEHQETKASREKRQETNRANGAKGGRPAKVNRTETQSVSEPKPAENQSQRSESETDLTTDMTYVPGSSPVVDAGERGLDPNVIDLIRERTAAVETATTLGVKDLWALHGLLETAAGQRMSPNGAVDLIKAVLLKARDENVRNIDAYVATVCRTTPETIADAYDQYQIGDVA